jgi:ribosomal protein S18 acetylase RimI-like enzyme
MCSDHPAPVILRPAIPSDADAVGRIRVAAWRAAYRSFMPASYLDALDPLANLDSLRVKLASPSDDFKLAVAEVNGLVVGFSIIGEPRYETSPGCLELWALNVSPEHWRRGIGRSLTLQAVREAASSGCDIELWCISGNLPAQAAYESCGFLLTGKERTSSSLTGHPLHEVLYSKSQ